MPLASSTARVTSKRQTVFVNENLTEFRVHRLARMGHRLIQVHAQGHRFLRRVEQGTDEITGVGEAGLNARRAVERRAATGHQFFGTERRQCIERRRPLFELCITGVAGGVGFDQIARKQHLF
jgi:hypothetical protein